jgi:type I restriction enzyme, S subunit
MKAAVIVDTEDHITEAAVSASATNIVPAGSVLAVTRSGILRRAFPVAVTVTAVSLNQDLKALRPVDGIDPRYVAWFLRKDEGLILHECTKDGTTVDSIDFPKFLKRTIPLAPTAEQKRIVAAIEEQISRVDAGYTALEEAIRNLKRIRHAFLDEAFGGVPTEQWLYLADVGQVVTGNTPNTKNAANYGKGLPFVTPSDFDHGSLVTQVPRALTELGAQAARPIPSGSVLATCIGATLGKVTLTAIGCATNQQINAVVPGPQISGKYLFYCLARPAFTATMWREASSTTMPILNKSRFSALRIPVVSVDQQLEIVERLDHKLAIIDKLVQEVDDARTRSNHLRSSILEAAFGGRLVRQNAEEESASTLLKRITSQQPYRSNRRKHNSTSSKGTA